MSETGKEHASRQQILAAAESLFAANGFGSTSVDSIAKRAGVNKATIYYYFESKQSILDNIIEEFLQSFTTMSKSMLQSAGMMDVYASALTFSEHTIAINDEAGLNSLMEALGCWLDDILQFFAGKRDVLRIMIVESVKDGGNGSLLFRLSDLLASSNTYRDILSEMGVSYFPEEIIIMKFFGGFLPIIFHAVCANEWETHYAMQKETLRQGMLALFRMELAGYFRMMGEPAKE